MNLTLHTKKEVPHGTSFQWTWRESNPRPKASPSEHLPSQPFLLEFPRQSGERPPQCFGSFILRPLPQSFGSVVSYDHDAGIREHRYNRADERHLGR